jgi:CheY-like chemotaxis protein
MLILEDDYALALCNNTTEAKEAFAKEVYDLVILDKNLPLESAGLELLRHFRVSRPGLRAIMLTDYADVESAVKSMKLGALDYVSKSTADLRNVLRLKVEQALASITPDEPLSSKLISLIKKGESGVLEFKSSLRWDRQAKKQSKELEKTVIKTVAAFMNSEEESNLLIGVSDDGSVAGLRQDYKTLGQRQDRDGFENLLMSLVLEACGKDCAPLLKVAFHRVDDQEVCQVRVKPSPKPVFVRDEKGEHLFVRTGNSTRLLSTREAIEYCKLRWRSGVD